jgi:hypothetical protein
MFMKMIPRYAYDKSFTVRFPDRCEQKDGLRTDRKVGLIWYTGCSKTSKGTGAGVYGYGTRWKVSFSLEQYTTEFQAEEYTIKACVVENLERNYRNRNIYILQNSQAAINAFSNHQITLKLVWDCHQSFMQLTEHKRVQLIWVQFIYVPYFMGLSLITGLCPGVPIKLFGTQNCPVICV